MPFKGRATIAKEGSLNYFAARSFAGAWYEQGGRRLGNGRGLPVRQLSRTLRASGKRSNAQREGVARMLPGLIEADGVSVAESESHLTQVFGDSELAVRQAIAEICTIEHILGLAVAPRIVKQLVRSAAFECCADQLFCQLDETMFNLVPFQDAPCRADRLAALPPDNRPIRRRAGSELSSLLVRLYDQAIKMRNSSLAEQCLDRWDE